MLKVFPRDGSEPFYLDPDTEIVAAGGRRVAMRDIERLGIYASNWRVGPGMMGDGAPCVIVGIDDPHTEIAVETPFAIDVARSLSDAIRAALGGKTRRGFRRR